jgi:ubiquinone/menaquinone biosynthesis C-methylase UbiE/uncharacterized protein YbaR (Trm112 family)
MKAHVQPPTLARFSSLQNILCCPHTKTRLRLVGIEELLASLSDSERARIPDQTIGAFISDAAHKAYPVTERVADFLAQDSLRIHTVSSATDSSMVAANSDDDLKQSVKVWYDRFGWRKNAQGLYHDTASFSQDRPVGHGLYEMMSHLSILDRLPGGQFVLDAASGAIAHPEYLAFSWFFESRVCVDMSIAALKEADAKLRETDFCCLSDICRLPFRDETFDGAISGYTIQHIPESQQLTAIRELYRIIRPHAHLCILTGMPYSPQHQGLFFLLRAFRMLLMALHLVRPQLPPSSSDGPGAEAPPHALYAFLQKLAWWKKVARGLTDKYSIESLRILNKSEFEWLFGQSNQAAKMLRLIENAFPRLTSGMSAYCLIDICKPAGDTKGGV